MSETYDLVGGTPVEVEPLNVSENGTYKLPRGKAYNPVKVNVSGGGDDVYYATYTRHIVEVDPDTGEEICTFDCDKTCAEILEQVAANRAVAAKLFWNEEDTTQYHIIQLQESHDLDDDIPQVVFFSTFVYPDDPGFAAFNTYYIAHYVGDEEDIIEAYESSDVLPAGSERIHYVTYRRTVEVDPESGDEIESFTCDETLEEILSAIGSGVPVAAKYYANEQIEGGEDWCSAPLTYVNTYNGTAGVTFGYTIIEPGDASFYFESLEISHYEGGEIEVLQIHGYLAQAGT